MELMRYVEDLRHELISAAETGDARTRELAERLVAPLSSTVRLVLLDALSAAADEITRELAPGVVEVRLRGLDPGFVVTPPPTPASPDAPVTSASSGTSGAPVTRDGATARVNFRPPEHLKSRIEEAASRDGLSVNAWLVRAVSALLPREEPVPPVAPAAPRAERARTGWVV
ncbi:hypothetical protein [Streptomyces abikoensis]